MMVTRDMARLIHFIGLETGDADLVEQGERLSENGGNFYAPADRWGLKSLARAASEISPVRVVPTHAFAKTVGGFINRLPLV